MLRLLLSLVLAFSFLSPLAAGEVEKGVVAYKPPAEEKMPERFRLKPHEFPFERKVLDPVSEKFELSLLTFPSPVETPVTENNTVHCEYFRPTTPGKHPAVIMLHILGGDFELSRLFCNTLAHSGVAALFVKMPYYGPRRGPNSPRRMVSTNPEETLEGMTQVILDVRRATAWLASREEVDASRLGVCGISLGGITAALALTAEPRLSRGCLLLAGADGAKIAWDNPQIAKYRDQLVKAGYTREKLVEMFTPIDPVNYGASVKGKKILMLNAKDDNVIPRVHTEALWEAFGKPEIVWYPGNHYTVGWSMPNALVRTSKFFAEP